MPSLLFEIYEYFYPIFLDKSQLWRTVFLACRIQARSMYGVSLWALCMCCLEKARVALCAKFWLSVQQCLPDRDWVTAVLLSGCGQSGWMVMLLESFTFYILWGRNRREPRNWKDLSVLTVHSLHASSGEKGEINLEGPKRSLIPWDGGAGQKAMLTLYIMNTVRQEELPYRHLLVRKIKI